MGKRFDVAIIGAGITGLATAWHLERLGVKKIALLDPLTIGANETLACPGLFFGGSLDNFTRSSHRHGKEIAAALWRFADESFDLLLSFAEKTGVPHLVYNRLRLISETDELNEARQAVSQLSACGFTPQLSLAIPHPHLSSMGVQRDGGRGGWLAPDKLLATLRRSIAAPTIRHEVSSLRLKRSGIALQLGDENHEIHAEIVVLACHGGISKLLPVFREVLVPVASQWLKLSVTGDFPATMAELDVGVGSVFSATHGNRWGGVLPRALLAGGGNYLRPLAGIGQLTSCWQENIAVHLEHWIAEQFAFKPEQLVRELGGVGVDIRPWDELPVIGPMFAEGRILVASGYMGQGLTLGFNGGRCLAQLIAWGEAHSLPRILWPERLRSS